MKRVQRISQHLLSGSEGSTGALAPSATSAAMSEAAKSDDDVVICCALRTAIGKAPKGSFKDTPAEDMLTPLFKAVVEKTKIDATKIDDIQIGNVLMPGSAIIAVRQAQLMGTVPYTVPISSVNRQCSSGLQAVANIASNIKAGVIDVGIAGGVESMSMYSMMDSIDPEKVSEKIFDTQAAVDCLTPMGITSENVAEKYQISRATQDTMAAASHAKAAAAQKAGYFKDEIVPVTTTVKDKASGKTKEVTVSQDEGPRAETTVSSLGTLKPAFKKGGSTTAGNASQLSDGAALVLMARRSAAKALGLPILARMRSFSVVGVDPNIMGIGPAVAIPEALKKAGVGIDDIDVFEVNEAFASQATMTVQTLKIPEKKLNPKGGAIALGHPLGCTGARQIATMLPELKRTGGKLGVVSMCIGTGMGAAGVFENEQ